MAYVDIPGIRRVDGTQVNPATEDSLADVKTSVQTMDDWDESDRAKVNPIVGQAGVQGGSGTVSATTQRVVLATDVGLPAGSSVLGTVKVGDGADTVGISTVGSAKALKVDVVQTTGGGSSVVTGALQNGAETAVDGTAGGVLIFTADASAKLVVIQNTGAANMRVGVSGVTATTGVQIKPGGDWDFGGVVPTTNIYAIREGAVNTTAFATKMT